MMALAHHEAVVIAKRPKSLANAEPAVAAILSENEHLRQENAKLQRLKTLRSLDREGLQAAQEELDALRARNAELERVAREAREQAMSKPVQPTVRSVVPRFSVRGWESERRGRDGRTDASQTEIVEAVENSQSALVLAESPPVQATAFDSNLDDEGTELAVVSTGEPSALQNHNQVSSDQVGHSNCPWIFQASLTGPAHRFNNNAEQVQLLANLREKLACGNDADLRGLLVQALATHIECNTSFYLSFSSLIPPLFDLIRENEGLEISMLCSDRNHTAADEVSQLGKAFERCANLIRHLMQSSKFGEKPPSKRPEEISRCQFVRELCSQVGLSLDLARLGFVQRDLMNPRKNESRDTSKRSRSRSRNRGQDPSPASVDKKELQTLLSRAGHFLSALQMDMDRLQDDAIKNRDRNRELRYNEVAQAPAPKVEPNSYIDSESEAPAKVVLSEALVLPVVASLRPEPEPMTLTEGSEMDEREQLVVQQDAKSNSVEITSSDLDQSVAQDAVHLHTVERSSSELDNVDPLVTPTFGEFVEKQLLPLYVADVPFESLQHLLERYCGIPLDSDDEEQALSVIGRNRSSKTSVAQRRRALLRQTSTASAKSSERGAPSKSKSKRPSGVTGEATFAELCRAEPRGPLGNGTSVTTGDQPRLPMRAQMLSSVAEKRWKGQAATRDMAIRPSIPATKSKGTSSTSATSRALAAPPATPTTSSKWAALRPSAALFRSPGAPVARTLELSPVSTRATRQQQHMDTTSKRMRKMQPSWDLLPNTPLPASPRGHRELLEETPLLPRPGGHRNLFDETPRQDA